MILLQRRTFLLGASATLIGVPAMADAAGEIAALETKLGGRVGVAALDTGNGKRLAHRAEERFAMASTFKWMLAALVLARADKGELRLDARVPYTPADLLPNSPVTTAHVSEGALSIEALAAAAVEYSDNTAANLLLNQCGGPAGLTSFLRACGDPVTRLDRTEPALNANLPGDKRDTTTPAAVVANLQKLLLGDVLSDGAREKLIGWLKACETGKKRLRAGLPPDWVTGDKTGSGANGAINDVAITWPPNRAPILIACYMSGSKATADALNAAHAKVGALVAAAFS